MPTAFISYSHRDRDFVQRLARDLERAGLASSGMGELHRPGCRLRRLRRDEIEIVEGRNH